MSLQTPHTWGEFASAYQAACNNGKQFCAIIGSMVSCYKPACVPGTSTAVEEILRDVRHRTRGEFASFRQLGGLVERLLHGFSDPRPGTLAKRVKDMPFESFMQSAKEGSSTAVELIVRALFPNRGQAVYNGWHRLVAHIAARAAEQSRKTAIIVTTNFDECIEAALVCDCQAREKRTSSMRKGGWPEMEFVCGQGIVKVLKPHGTITSYDTMVTAFDQVAKNKRASKVALDRMEDNIAKSGFVLVLGYGANDFDLREAIGRGLEAPRDVFWGNHRAVDTATQSTAKRRFFDKISKSKWLECDLEKRNPDEVGRVVLSPATPNRIPPRCQYTSAQERAAQASTEADWKLDQLVHFVADLLDRLRSGAARELLFDWLRSHPSDALATRCLFDGYGHEGEYDKALNLCTWPVTIRDGWRVLNNAFRYAGAESPLVGRPYRLCVREGMGHELALSLTPVHLARLLARGAFFSFLQGKRQIRHLHMTTDKLSARLHSASLVAAPVAGIAALLVPSAWLVAKTDLAIPVEKVRTLFFHDISRAFGRFCAPRPAPPNALPRPGWQRLYSWTRQAVLRVLGFCLQRYVYEVLRDLRRLSPDDLEVEGTSYRESALAAMWPLNVDARYALHFLIKAKDVSEQLDDVNVIALVNLDFGAVYLRKGQIPQAYLKFREASELTRMQFDTKNTRKVATAIIRTLLAWGTACGKPLEDLELHHLAVEVQNIEGHPRAAAISPLPADIERGDIDIPRTIRGLLSCMASLLGKEQNVKDYVDLLIQYKDVEAHPDYRWCPELRDFL